jgi:Amt family ammonium transporter
MLALAGATVIGPRIGKFKKDGTSRAFPGHDIPMAIIGTIILFFCWFAFNASSTMNASDLRLTVAATNTMISGAVGGTVAMFYMWIKYGKPDPSMTANGALAGSGRDHLALRICERSVRFHHRADRSASGLQCRAVRGKQAETGRSGRCDFGSLRQRPLGRDFGRTVRGRDLRRRTERSGRKCTRSVLRRCLAARRTAGCGLCLFLWGFGMSYLFFRILDKVWGLRVTPEQELDGLDIPEMGVLAYPDSQLLRTELDYGSEDNAPIPQLNRFKDYDMKLS